MRLTLPDELKFLENRNAAQKRSAASMEGKTCVVTGASSGVGLESALRLARGGARLVLAGRDRDRTERAAERVRAAGPGPVETALADFSDLGQVRAAAARVLELCPRIDVLVNSAGMHSTTRKLTGAGFELVFCVNHLAPFLLTNLLEPRLRESAPARVVMVNSEGHRFGGLDLDDLDWARRHYTGLRGYGASKTAQLLCTWEWADRLAGAGVTVNALHPGDVRTDIGRNNGPLYRAFTRVAVRPFLRDPSVSGEAVYWLAAEPSLAGTTGKFYHLTVEERPAAHALDRELGRRVWEASRRLTGLDPA